MAAQNGHKPASSGKSHSRFGLSNLLHSSKSSHSAPTPSQPPPSAFPPSAPANSSPPSTGIAMLDAADPGWRGLLGELLEMGFTEDQIEQNADFIKDYIEQKKASQPAEDGVQINGHGRGQAPPPLPSSAPPIRQQPISPQDTGNTMSSKRGPPPAPPPARGSRRDFSGKPPSPPASPAPIERTPSPPRLRFKAPPPLAEAGKFAHVSTPALPTRARASSNVANPGPPPPPRPPKTTLDDEEVKPRFGVPPPFTGERTAAPTAPPPPPNRTP